MSAGGYATPGAESLKIEGKIECRSPPNDETPD
jgi:hypothetical protein